VDRVGSGVRFLPAVADRLDLAVVVVEGELRQVAEVLEPVTVSLCLEDVTDPAEVVGRVATVAVTQAAKDQLEADRT